MSLTDCVARIATLFVLLTVLVSSSEAATLQLTDSASVDNAVVVNYDPSSGNLNVEGNGVAMTTVELTSASSLFDPSGIPEGLLLPPFDVASDSKLFHLNTAGFFSLDLGAPLAPGLGADQLTSDLAIRGSILPSGALTDADGGGPFLYVVPEPATFSLVGLGVLLIAARWRKR